MNPCEHRRCASKFCPDCGELVNSNPLDQLRRHIVRTRDRYIDQARSYEIDTESVRARTTDPKDRDAEIERRRSVAQRWASWVEAIDELIEKAGGTK